MTVEESFQSLEEILEKLENKETTLEEAFLEYEKGIKIVNECNKELDKVEEKINILGEDGSVESVNEDEF